MFLAIGRLRKEARDEIERLLGFLDETDNHMELEPSLGWPEPKMTFDGERYSHDLDQSGKLGATDDRELEPEHDEETGDDEPSLASLDRMADQTKWAAGGMMDAELDESDDEPSLGSGATFSSSSQAHWAQGASDEREDMNEDGDGSGANGTVDDEPSLGSTATINQEAWSFGNNCDREQGTTRRFREEPKPASICNVTMLDGSPVTVESVS